MDLSQIGLLPPRYLLLPDNRQIPQKEKAWLIRTVALIGLPQALKVLRTAAEVAAGQMAAGAGGQLPEHLLQSGPAARLAIGVGIVEDDAQLVGGKEKDLAAAIPPDDPGASVQQLL